MSCLSLLMGVAPNWFSVISRGADIVDGVCSVVDDTATSDREYSITIKMVGEDVYARETVVGEKLPMFCYDRHIMTGGWFCIGLEAGSSVTTAAGARDWWSNLSEFLRLQAVAKATGRWPRAMEFDHGQAGYFHKSALDAAAKLNISEDYELALLGKKSWITTILSQDGKRLMNGRSPCPVGCVRKGRRLLRNECCSTETVLELVRNERLRAAALVRFWESIRKDAAMVCCGTMINCPLKDRPAAGGNAHVE